MSVVWVLIIVVAAFFFLKRRPPLEIPQESQTAVKASGKCGPDAEWRLHEDGQLYITGNGSMYDYEPETTEHPEKLRLGIRIGVTFIRLLWIGEFPALDGGPLHIFSI